MNTQFYELLNISKIEYTTPGRCVDEDNEICDYYIDYQYPSILPVFFDLLDYYLQVMNGKPFALQAITTDNLCEMLQDKIVERLWELSKYHNVQEETQELYEILDEFYHFEERMTQHAD